MHGVHARSFNGLRSPKIMDCSLNVCQEVLHLLNYLWQSRKTNLPGTSGLFFFKLLQIMPNAIANVYIATASGLSFIPGKTRSL